MDAELSRWHANHTRWLLTWFRRCYCDWVLAFHFWAYDDDMGRCCECVNYWPSCCDQLDHCIALLPAQLPRNACAQVQISPARAQISPLAHVCIKVRRDTRDSHTWLLHAISYYADYALTATHFLYLFTHSFVIMTYFRFLPYATWHSDSDWIYFIIHVFNSHTKFLVH